MVWNVRLLLDGAPVEPAAYGAILIASPAVDRIVNEIYERGSEADASPAASLPLVNSGEDCGAGRPMLYFSQKVVPP